jgi:hypothetical protein
MTKPGGYSRGNTTHGLCALKKIITTRGMQAVSARSYAVKAVRAWEAELIRDLGGAENLSTQKRTIVEMCCRTRLFIEHIDSWIMLQDFLVYNRKKKLIPVVQQRQALCDSLTRMLAQLGLDRQAKKVEDLDQFFARRAREKAEGKSADGADDTLKEEPIEADTDDR